MRSAAVYGSNAAGKTNLLRAIQFMQEMVVTSAARPSGARATPYSPYKFSPKTCNSPSDFQITFPENNVRYEYGFSLSAERVEREWLIEYVTSKGRTLFQRDYDNRAKKYKWSFSSFFKGQRLLWSESNSSRFTFPVDCHSAKQHSTSTRFPVVPEAAHCDCGSCDTEREFDVQAS